MLVGNRIPEEQLLYPDLRRGLVGYWRPSCGPSGGILFDGSPSRNHGTLTNMGSPTDWLFDDGGYYLDFDGANDYVNLGTASHLQLTGDMTVACWVKTTSTGTFREIFNAIGTSPGYQGWGVGLGSSVGKFGAYQGGQGVWRDTTASVNDGKWHLCCAVLLASTSRVLLYVDGALDSDQAGVSNRGVTDSDVTIGGRAVSPTRYFPGQLDAMGVWNRALSAREILTLYGGGHRAGRGIMDETLGDVDIVGAAAAITYHVFTRRSAATIGGGLS